MTTITERHNDTGDDITKTTSSATAPDSNSEEFRDFRQFLRGLIGLSGIKRQYIDALTDQKGIAVYYDAFTHSSVDPQRNYEWLEILGDATLNKAIVWYVSRRFPILQNPEGVKVIARLKINMVSKKKFSELAHMLGMDRHIRFDVTALPTHNSVAIRSILEDVFEAFFGATEWLIDQVVENGAGYGVCYTILSRILDKTDISLEYTDLYDSVTRLKETYDIYRTRLAGNLRYDNKREEYTQYVTIRHVGAGNVSYMLASAQASTLDEARQLAASRALVVLERKGIIKPVPPYYVKIREWIQENASKIR